MHPIQSAALADQRRAARLEGAARRRTAPGADPEAGDRWTQARALLRSNRPAGRAGPRRPLAEWVLDAFHIRYPLLRFKRDGKAFDPPEMACSRAGPCE